MNNQVPSLGLNEYSRLRHVARCLISRESVCTLTATGLVHELLIKDSQTRREASNSSSGTKPGVLLPYASRVMKQLLIDRARKRMTRRKLETKAQDEANARHQRAAQFAVELDDTIAQLGTEMPDSNWVVCSSGNSTKSLLYSLAVSMKNSLCLAKSLNSLIVRISY